MLSLGVGGGGEGRERRPAAPWHSPSSGRALARDPGVNIKQKISQWEGRRHHEEAQGGGVKARVQAITLSRTLSGDLLGNGDCADNRGREGQVKVSLSKAKSLGLDFREDQGRGASERVGRKLELQRNHKCLDGATGLRSALNLTSTPSPNPAHNPAAKTGRANADAGLPEADPSSLPSAVEDPLTSLPPGNFYTSRGFWRRLEGSPGRAGVRTEGTPSAERGLSPMCPPPPKPQRTFQYRGADSPPGRWCRWEYWTPPKGHASGPPPSCPPPPCPVTQGNGFSRHKKNR